MSENSDFICLVGFCIFFQQEVMSDPFTSSRPEVEILLTLQMWQDFKVDESKLYRIFSDICILRHSFLGIPKQLQLKGTIAMVDEMNLLAILYCKHHCCSVHGDNTILRKYNSLNLKILSWDFHIINQPKNRCGIFH